MNSANLLVESQPEVEVSEIGQFGENGRNKTRNVADKEISISNLKKSERM
jgi:hypothetical protein